MAPNNRDRRTAKQRRRDVRRGHDPANPSPAAGAGIVDPGLPPETLRRVLHDAARLLAVGDEDALTGLRHMLAEHLARRRPQVLAACDEVLAGVAVDDSADTAGLDGLAADIARGGTVNDWAEREGVTAEDAAVATVRLLAAH